MDAFTAVDLLAGLDPDRHDFAEFFRSSTLSLTIAHWPAGSADDQQPHTEDEVYYVVSGRARLLWRTRTWRLAPVASRTSRRAWNTASTIS
jgi:hypothetical protein